MGLSEACTTFFLLYTVLRGLCAAFWLTRSIASRAANIKHRRGLAIHATRPVAWPRFRVGLPTMLSTFCAAFFLTRRGGLFASAAYAAAICFRKLITLSRCSSNARIAAAGRPWVAQSAASAPTTTPADISIAAPALRTENARGTRKLMIVALARRSLPTPLWWGTLGSFCQKSPSWLHGLYISTLACV